MYGERFELVSDPFVQGDYTAVHAISPNDRGIRELRLPTAILVGLPDLFRQKAKVPGQERALPPAFLIRLSISEQYRTVRLELRSVG